jgi:methylmalonyl-CoA mutase N-terminal domain/subunit
MIKEACARFPEHRENFATTSGIEMKRLFTPEDVEQVDYSEDIGFSGIYPFTHRVQPTMYRARFWTTRQYAGFGSAEETNIKDINICWKTVRQV